MVASAKVGDHIPASIAASDQELLGESAGVFDEQNQMESHSSDSDWLDYNEGEDGSMEECDGGAHAGESNDDDDDDVESQFLKGGDVRGDEIGHLDPMDSLADTTVAYEIFDKDDCAL